MTGNYKSKKSAESIGKNKLEGVGENFYFISGLPRSTEIKTNEIVKAIAAPLRDMIKAIKDVLQETPPELVADLMQRGIILAGGGSLLRGLDVLIQKSTEIPTRVVDDPLTAVVRGCGIILEDVDNLREILIN